MFYHQVLLQRRGQFGIIWMEAMQSSPYRVTKRQALQVNIRKSCANILDYVYARLRDERGKRSRFSLYLSAHLMYGVVSIWRKQIQILLADAQEIKSRVGLEIAALEGINLRITPRLEQITLPDAVSRAADDNPFFGSLKHFDDGWEYAMQVNVFPVASPPSASVVPAREQDIVADDHERFEPEIGSPNTVASKAEITLRETPFSTSPLLEIQVPGEKDIPTLEGEELEMIMPHQGDELVLTLEDLLPESAASTALRSPQLAPDRGETTPPKETKKEEGRTRGEKRRRKRRAEDLEQTQTEQPSASKRLSPHDISLELLPVEVSPRRRRLQRELFVDVHKEMSKDDIRHNLSTSHTTCRQFVLPAPTPSTPADLFKRPGSKHLARNPLLKRLWQRNCKESLLETESDKDIPIWSVPDLVRGKRGLKRVRRLDSSAEEELSPDEARELVVEQHMGDVPLDMDQPVGETPSIEVIREGSLSRSMTPQHSSLLLPVDKSQGEASLSFTRPGTTKSRQEVQAEDHRASSQDRSISSADEAALQADITPQLEVLHEELEEVPLSPPVFPVPQAVQLFSPEKSFIRRCEVEGSEKYTTFKDVCPTTLTRPHAARCFITLLAQCAEGKLFVRQLRAYGDIYISTSKHHLPRSVQ